MTSDVVLTAALRNNLLSLQRTQGLIDKTQLRLATGLKVNSALDNPQNFFASQALKNRASDLNRLLDGIGQNIQVIKAADNGVSALTKLIEQADSVVQSARDALAQGSSEAKATGDKDLTGIADLTALSGISEPPLAADQLVISVVDPETDTLVDFDPTAGTSTTLTITINTGDSIDELITRINDNNNIAEPVIEAALDSNGRLELRTLNGGDFSIQFNAQGGAGVAADHLALAEALGFGQVARLTGDGAGADLVTVTASADTVLKSFSLYEGGSSGADRAERSDLLWDTAALAGEESLEDEEGNQLFVGIDSATDEFTISVDGSTTQTIALNGLTVQGFIDAINTNASLNTLIEADFDDANSQITIRAIDPTVQDVTIGAIADAATDTVNFGFGTTLFGDLGATVGTPVGATGTNALEETIRFGASAGKLAELEIEYNNIRSQVDELVSNGDTGYRGTNLLFGDNLTTFFNEFRSSSLDTEGVTFNSAGLGLDEAEFTSSETIDAVGDQVRAALEDVRSFGTTLANDLAIIQTREQFTQDIINTLNEGSDKLTVADQNEEGAKLLSLQTRQQLGVTSLSLASQSQQSILRLF
jgi:flagellin-like hook-associated protein FlgL